MKGIAIVIMLFHHMYLSQDRIEGLNESIGSVIGFKFCLVR